MFTVDPNIGDQHNNDNNHKDPKHPNEPLSGSKKVKNHNHSRNNHGEGS
ncbi:small acid-soluble spore protein P [Paenibacillus endoradicis]